MVIFFIVANANNLYPFGENSIAWADVTQQVIPLLNSFKDILSGKASFIYNVNQAGGMSFFGIFFFFLASPSSLLVLFVSKAKMMVFVNLLIMFKLMGSSLSLGYYLKKKYPTLNPLISVAFSLLYAYSAYNLMYYQNMMWLTMAALFPLLFLSIEEVVTKSKILPYIILMSLTMITNYYIGMLEVLIILLFVGLLFIVFRKEENIHKKAWLFLFASLVSALLSMLVLLPSLASYLASARTTTFVDALMSSWFITHYQTTLPLLLGVSFLAFFLFKGPNSSLRTVKLMMLGILFIPMIIDPINKALHFGSYQAFPVRFFFIMLFLVLDLSAETLDQPSHEVSVKKEAISFVFVLVLLAGLVVFASFYLKQKITDLDAYATSLWGSTTSLEALLRYYIIIIIGFSVIMFFYKAKLISKRSLGFVLLTLSVLESVFAFNIYVVPASRSDSYYQDFYELENLIDDDSFYRVKTNKKLQNVNDLGALGYANIGHYTSLTKENHMFTMKKLGYSSYWMEVGAYGGTTFTDALLLNKYTIHQGSNNSYKYHTDNYYVSENKVLPFGLVTKADLSKEKVLEEDSRPNMQEYIYQTLFDETSPLHTSYEITNSSNVSITEEEGYKKFEVNDLGTVNYSLQITNKETLYFEAFDEYTNNLVETFNESIRVYANGYLKTEGDYPSKRSNGTISLGTFENETVNVRVTINKNISVKSFNVFSVNEQKLEETINNAKNAALTYQKSKITGTYFASSDDEYLFLPLVYANGIKAKINNKKASAIEVFSTFIAIKLVAGNNNISLVFHEPTLLVGASVSLVGVILLSLYYYFIEVKKHEVSLVIQKVSYYTLITASGLVFFVTYILSIILNIIGQI